MLATSESSKTALAGKFHSGPLKKNRTKAQRCVKWGREASGHHLIWRGPHSWHLGGAFLTALSVSPRVTVIYCHLEAAEQRGRAHPSCGACGWGTGKELNTDFFGDEGKSPRPERQWVSASVSVSLEHWQRRGASPRERKSERNVLQAWGWTWLHTCLFFVSQLGIIYFAIFRSKNLSLLSLPLAVLKLENGANLNIGPWKTSQGQVLSKEKIGLNSKSKQTRKKPTYFRMVCITSLWALCYKFEDSLTEIKFRC